MILLLRKRREEIYYKLGGISTNTKQIKSGVIDAFVESILRNEPPQVSGEDDYKVLEIVFACLKSSLERKWVSIKEVYS